MTLTDLDRGEHIQIAVLPDPAGGATNPEVAAAVRTTADLLAGAGHDVVEVTPPDYEHTIELWAELLFTDIATQRTLLDLVVSDDDRAVLDSLAAAVPPPSLEQLAQIQAARFRLMQEWSELIERPVLISPTSGQPPFEHGADLGDNQQLMRDTLRPALATNLLALPAGVVPCGTADGMPVGIQVIGDRFTDLLPQHRGADPGAGLHGGADRSSPARAE